MFYDLDLFLIVFILRTKNKELDKRSQTEAFRYSLPTIVEPTCTQIRKKTASSKAPV
jgi:hypothetical protein